MDQSLIPSLAFELVYKQSNFSFDFKGNYGIVFNWIGEVAGVWNCYLVIQSIQRLLLMK